MSKGVILFAFNTDTVDYYKMAVYTAKRVNHFLNLPVTVVTDTSTDIENYNYKFDNIIIQESDKTNKREFGKIWINKGRYTAYSITPYTETLVLDTDYLINSDKLLKPFGLYDDFMCHNSASVLMAPALGNEDVSANTFKTLWATVLYFKKSNKTEQVFQMMQLIQQNYIHYLNIYNFLSSTYRNDYALTIALRTVYGQTEDLKNYIPWNLLHVGKNTTVFADSTDIYNTNYTVIYDNWQRGKIRKEYCTITDMDFHMLNKNNFMEFINE
jgi:hypothetical protein